MSRWVTCQYLSSIRKEGDEETERKRTEDVENFEWKGREKTRKRMEMYEGQKESSTRRRRPTTPLIILLLGVVRRRAWTGKPLL